MSAIVCGKRSFFEELPTSPLVSKKLRYSSTSPSRFSPPRNNSPTANSSSSISQTLSQSPSDCQYTVNSPSVAAALDRLLAIFPEMDKKLLERALEESGDLESAIKSLNELRLGSAGGNFSSVTVKTDSPSQDIDGGGAATLEEPVVSNLPKNGAEWVDLFVNEMTSAANIDDARARASRVLEVLEKSIRTQAGAEAADNLHKEHMMLKEQMELLIRENGILKRAVAIQHERQKEADDKNQELQHLKQLVSQYQERVRALEVSNYALTMHLRQAQQSSSMPGRYHPDVF